jgi:predicted 2-oxoglutarate/Fe(II)-dependent dioxygenase YbiX
MRHYEVTPNFITDEDSLTLMTALNKAISENPGNMNKDRRFSIADSKEEHLRALGSKYGNKILSTFPDSPYTNVSGYVLEHISSKGLQRKHTDSLENEEYTAVIYLNEEFDGGELVVETPHDYHFVYKPVKNSLVWFPSWYPHSVAQVSNGARYVLVINFMSGHVNS